MKVSKWNTFRADCIQFLLERMDGWRDTNVNGIPTKVVPQAFFDRKLIVNFPNQVTFEFFRRYMHTYLGVPFWALHSVRVKLVTPHDIEVCKTITLMRINEDNATPVATQLRTFSLADSHGRTRKIVSEWRNGWFEEFERFMNDPFQIAPELAPWAKANLMTQSKENEE